MRIVFAIKLFADNKNPRMLIRGKAHGLCRVKLEKRTGPVKRGMELVFDWGQVWRYPSVMPKKGEPRYDTCWRKSRIAARILLREEAGQLTARDVALGHKLAADRGVTPRLIWQAIYGFRGASHQLELSRRKAA